MPVNDFINQLQALRRQFLAQLPERMESLAICLQRFRDSGETAGLKKAHFDCHTLTGSGRTFGTADISRSARLLEELLADALRNGPGPGAAGAMEQAFIELQQAAEAACQPKPAAGGRRARPVGGRTRGLLYLVERDPGEADSLAARLGTAGYRVRNFPTPQALLEEAPSLQPSAVIVDFAFLDGDWSCPRPLLGMPAPGLEGVPLVFISELDDFRARLEAVRAGAIAYFQKPLDFDALEDTLEGLAADQLPMPYRILIADRDQALARFYGKTLQDAAMEVSILPDPTEIIAGISDFQPDVLLVSLQQTVCTGAELAALVRQQDALAGIAMVFLTAEEKDGSQELSAFRQGADDVLSKPFSPARLISSLRRRARRARLIRERMDTDGLTGLLKPASFRERLEQEVLRSQRVGLPLSLAMMNLDHLKAINDAHGHPAGDRVLRHLSEILRQRLRRTDIAGRWSGEEFGVILTDTEAPGAERVLETIRQDFVSHPQLVGNREIHASFSSGIAELRLKTADSLTAAADAALHRAKEQGRDRIVISAV